MQCPSGVIDMMDGKNQRTGFTQLIQEQKKTGAFQHPVSFVAIL